jgi:hypothetical protein
MDAIKETCVPSLACRVIERGRTHGCTKRDECSLLGTFGMVYSMQWIVLLVCKFAASFA